MPRASSAVRTIRSDDRCCSCARRSSEAELSRPANQAKIRKDLPVYVAAGSEDPVSEKTKGLLQLLRAYGKAGLTDVTHHFYQGARHEIFNELNRDDVTRELLGWLRTKLPALS